MNVFWKTVENELKKTGSSLTELSRVLSLPKNTVFSWRNNNRIPPADKAILIAEYLNSDLKYLLSGGQEGLSKEQSRWKSWIDSCSDEELENSRIILTAAREFHNTINKMAYRIPGARVKKIQAAENRQGSYKGKK